VNTKTIAIDILLQLTEMNFNNSTTTGYGNDNDQQHQQFPCSRHGDDLGYTDVTDVTTLQQVTVDHT